MSYEDWLADKDSIFKKQQETKTFEYKLNIEEKLDPEMNRVLEVRDSLTSDIIQYRLDEIDKALINSLTSEQLLQNDAVRELVEALRFYTDRYNFHIDVGDYRTSSFIEELPDNINDSSAFGTQAHKALEKFEGRNEK